MGKKIIEINGEVAPGFESIRTEFEKNFSQRYEHGAAVTGL
jgi:hypothetical protein